MDIVIKETPGVTIIHLNGEFHLESALEIEDDLSVVMEKDPPAIAFDCGALTFLDSSAIGTLVKYIKISEEKGVDVYFYNVTGAIDRIFKTTRLDNFLKILTPDEFNRKFPGKSGS